MGLQRPCFVVLQEGIACTEMEEIKRENHFLLRNTITLRQLYVTAGASVF